MRPVALVSFLLVVSRIFAAVFKFALPFDHIFIVTKSRFSPLINHLPHSLFQPKFWVIQHFELPNVVIIGKIKRNGINR